VVETRKLVAILAADVVGYSRARWLRRGSDIGAAAGASERPNRPVIAVHSGRVVKRTGDGAIVEFRSVVDAVRCAIEVQNGMVERRCGGGAIVFGQNLCADLNQFDDAWRHVAEAATAVETTKEKWFEAELHRASPGEIALQS
jgi:hypothetical protein